MSVKDRVKEFINVLGINQNEFERSINASNGYVNSISKSIGLDKLERIIENYSNLNLKWLLAGKGDMFTDQNALSGGLVNEPSTSYGKKEICVIDHEQVVKQLNEERELLKTSHKEIGILEFKLHSTTTELEKARKEIERLKKMAGNVGKGINVS